MNSQEWKILARISDLNPGRHHRAQVYQLLARNLDGNRLINTAIKEGLAGLLYKYLLEADLLNTLNREQSQKLAQIYYQLLYTNLNLTNALKKVLHRLHEKDIQVVLLQGIDLIHRVYGDFGLRPLTDIDLWVLPKDFPGFIDIMIKKGFERDRIYPNTFRKGATIFDVHTHILWADRIAARKLILRNGETAVYKNTRFIRVDGQSARCLDPYDQVLYLSLHALKHYVNRLIWLVDIKCLVAPWAQTDWAGFMNRARELGQERIVAYLLFLLAHLLDFHPPESVIRLPGYHRLNVLEKKILRRRIESSSLALWAPVFLFSSGMNLRNRLQFMLESLFPDPDILRQVFPATSDLKVRHLYLKRILQVFDRK